LWLQRLKEQPKKNKPRYERGGSRHNKLEIRLCITATPPIGTRDYIDRDKGKSRFEQGVMRAKRRPNRARQFHMIVDID
jgi:hypothetical protein